MTLLFILAMLFLASLAYEVFAPASWKVQMKNGLFAKFTPGFGFSEIRGKVAATVYSKNAAGAVIRNRVTPINRRSNRQTEQRQVLASLSSGWRGLSQAQRDGWNAAAANFPQTDSLGQTVILTGEQLYIRCNANLTLIGQSLITNAPIPTSFDPLALGAITLTAAAFTVAFTPTPIPAGFNLVFRATRPVSAGKSFFGKSDYRFLEAIAAAGATPADLDATYEAIFGDKTGQVGQKVGIEAFLVEISSGLAGIPVRTSALIA